MNQFRADLHCHSTCSDGTKTPYELLQHAASLHLKAISITDHDSLKAYEPSTWNQAQLLNLYLLPGIELSAQYQARSVHILGYAFVPSIELLELCDFHRIRRKKRVEAMLVHLQRNNVQLHIDPTWYDTNHCIGRVHIAQQLIQQGYATSIQQAFDRYLVEGTIGYEATQVPSVEETIAIIHRAGGKAILAHPHLFHNTTIVSQLLAFPFDGVECFPWYQGKIKSIIYAYQKKGALLTAGSDYHGNEGRDVLGSTTVNEATFFQLYEHYLLLQQSGDAGKTSTHTT